MRRGQKKTLHRTQRNSSQGLHEKAEIQRKVLRRGKNLTFSKDTCLEKERVRSKVTPRKVGVGLKRKRELSKRRLGWGLAWWGSIEKKEASHLLELKGKRHHLDQHFNQIRTPCVASTAVGTGGGRRTKWPDRHHEEIS